MKLKISDANKRLSEINKELKEKLKVMKNEMTLPEFMRIQNKVEKIVKKEKESLKHKNKRKEDHLKKKKWNEDTDKIIEDINIWNLTYLRRKNTKKKLQKKLVNMKK